jgi:hypothetical protein
MQMAVDSINQHPLSCTFSNGFQVRVRGDTCDGVREFAIQAYEFSRRRPKQCSPSKFGTAYPLVIFFNCDFFKDVFEVFFSFQIHKRLFSVHFLKEKKCLKKSFEKITVKD